jgi:hypothetical protein
MTVVPAKVCIVLPENWTGSLDGEREETIIPSNETR